MGAYLPLPYVYEREGRQERAWDIYSRLLRDRIVFIGTPIDDYVANSIIAQLLFLQMEDPKKDIHVYINSPGGSVSDGMAIYDTLNFMECDIVTYCIGMACKYEYGITRCRYSWQKIRPAQQPSYDSPTKWWCGRTNI
jgi:ATP-dependent Clp protease protease subunit